MIYFTLTLEEAQKHEYDIIIVGTGIGGGVLAGDLFDSNIIVGEERAKHILVIEKGGLVFHSHCLNTSRPGLDGGRDQLNDAVFTRFRDNYTLSEDMTCEEKKDWRGGPVYCLGGRSSVWGLFSPRIHDANLRKYFPACVVNDLLKTYYRRAERLLEVNQPRTTPVHRELMERINMLSSLGELHSHWQWGSIASEFANTRNYHFSSGAYSTIDKLTEIAMNKPVTDGRPVEHKNFKILLETEVRSLIWDEENPNCVRGVNVRTANGREDQVFLKRGGRVVLCAGSAHTPAILLRSKVDLASMGGLHLTDHDIMGMVQTFSYRNPQARPFVGPMKLQSYIRTTGRHESSTLKNSSEVVLANMSIDSSSFLPRGLVPYDNLPKWIMVFVRPAELKVENTITLVSDEPQIKILRGDPPDNGTRDMLEAATAHARKAIQEVLNLEFNGEPPKEFGRVSLGGVAHELGTVPMKQAQEDGKPFCLTENLKLLGHKGVFVCDLSVFPFSPEVNPTLTLAALALRLSRETLLKRSLEVANEANNCNIRVVNHSGRLVKIVVGSCITLNSEDIPYPSPEELDSKDGTGHGFGAAKRTTQDDNSVRGPGDSRDSPTISLQQAACGSDFQIHKHGDNTVLLRPGDMYKAWKCTNSPVAVSVFRMTGETPEGPEFRSQAELIFAYPPKEAVVIANTSHSLSGSQHPHPMSHGMASAPFQNLPAASAGFNLSASWALTAQIQDEENKMW